MTVRANLVFYVRFSFLMHMLSLSTYCLRSFIDNIWTEGSRPKVPRTNATITEL